MPEAVAALRKHRAAQVATKLALGGAWDEQGWVFTNHLGKPIEHRRDLSDFKKLCAEAGLGDHRVPDMRHTTATMALLANIPTRAVQDLLGWSSTRMTYRYQHVVDDAKRATSAAMAAQIFGATGV